MAFPWVAAGTGTDQELLDLYRAAAAQIAATGQEYYLPDGSRLRRADLADIQRAIEFYEARVNAESGLSINLVRLTREP